MRTFLAMLGIAVLTGTSALAHHSYGDFLRDETVSLQGTIEHVLFANPHVTLNVRTQEGAAYTVEWASVTQLVRQGVRSDMLKVGDRIVVSGSPHRDPAHRKVTLLTEVRGPSGGWRWAKGTGVAP